MSTERKHFLDAATSIGRRLCRDAIWHEGRCGWLGWAMEPHGGQWVSVYRAASASVYDGTAGIGLFLAHLAHLTQDPIIAETAVGALAQALAGAEPLRKAGEYGFYSGLSGIAQSCIEAGDALGRDDIVARGCQEMRHCAALPPRGDRLDIINGSAGIIPVLLDAGKRFSEDAFVDAASRHGRHLVDVAARGDKGWSWDTLAMANEPHLLGFAHGASGIAYGLAALAVASERREFEDTAREGLRYERAHYRAAEGNWPDLRSFVQPGPTGEKPCMTAWCHGAPGIGFARLALLPLMPDDAAIRAEALVAVRTTATSLAQTASGLGNLSLCHGDGGNADLLLLAADMLGEPRHRAEAEGVATRALARFEEARAPWPCGVPAAGETPNLLLGLAGIGYFLLRLYDSTKLRSILLPAPIAENLSKGQEKGARRAAA